MTEKIKGIAASAGIAIAKTFILRNPDLSFERKTVEDKEAEKKKLNDALDISKKELNEIKATAERELGKDKAEVFSAHLMFLSDPEFVGQIESKIDSDSLSAESALQDVSTFFIQTFESMSDNAYMRERAADVRDVSKRLLAHLLGVSFTSPASITEETVIIAEDLTPSDTAQLNRKYVKGFATNVGGRTSHSAIMSRSMEIPAVVGTKIVLEKAKDGETAIVDGLNGEVILDPTDEEIKAYSQKAAAYKEQQAEWKKLVNEPTKTKDGAHVILGANIGNPGDVTGVVNNGGEAIGLYRTEFLYMGRDQLPTEDEQFDAYKEVVEKMKGKPVVIRTLDIGGDKKLKYLPLPEEMNPFLGFRAIRLCLERQDIFRTQLRALLRASAFGKLRIMFPMIATINEFREAKKILLEEKDKLVAAGTKVSDDLQVGMMMEIPAAAVLADQFAKEADFFSIGTNDLIQYTMAADRMNEHVSYLYQPCNPSILRLVSHVIDAAHKEGHWAGMCGEMAGDATAIPLLLALGLDEFSMSATSILPARSQLLTLSQEELAKHKEAFLNLSTADEVLEYVKTKMK
ncbi:phosphoenolpyruvate--protein phosphotransferase [Sporolactobacillus sp. THM19-2]|jgi:phosphotransferase system enzyme I (PtsI)|uniref:phosphoenolpyruvate--protein phosphotransferase n=1 Tax=Sporolactobacillus sp. THM19-2 TaxID=2511171 RepID=UPI001020A473|nr:phosphoenolpyruvate--protein phosphotransferase [Sporolactobacillus sp. THM19-2]RYL94076.1 phosphoenolpyruvate--protein phosphotransferase [Sporolactobacillus sp. THM19-2]